MTSIAKYKVRFNLGRGDRYMKWKVTYPTGAVRYYEPSEVALRLTGCTLKNRKASAEKIFKGANKFVVAWVEADSVKVCKRPRKKRLETKVSYNPRVKPNWVVDGIDADNEDFETILSVNRELFLPE